MSLDAAYTVHICPAVFIIPHSRIIVDSEVNTGAWTLMHRFNKATDLLGDVMQVGCCLPSALPWLLVACWLLFTWVARQQGHRPAGGRPAGGLGVACLLRHSTAALGQEDVSVGLTMCRSV